MFWTEIGFFPKTPRIKSWAEEVGGKKRSVASSNINKRLNPRDFKKVNEMQGKLSEEEAAARKKLNERIKVRRPSNLREDLTSAFTRQHPRKSRLLGR